MEKEMREALRRLNFDDLLKFYKDEDEKEKVLHNLGIKKIEDYSFAEYRREYSGEYKKNSYEHPEIKEVCTECEEAGCDDSPSTDDCSDDCKFKLRTMGHGAMSDDILLATKNKDENKDENKDWTKDIDWTGEDWKDWKEGGVIFALENPDGFNNTTYKDLTVEAKGVKHEKAPTIQWYWVN